MSENKTFRRTKKEYYKTEREEIINKMNEIIGINKNNMVFFCEIEKNEEIKSYLLNNIENIRKYYKTCKWGFFSKSEIRGKDNLIGLIRSIYGDSDYEIIRKTKYCTLYGVKKQYTPWDFRKLSK